MKTITDQFTQFDYLLNAFEQASQHAAPASVGYGDKRRALYAYVRALEAKAAAPEAEAPAAAEPASAGRDPIPFHPDASHVSPDWRDGWNAALRAASPQQERDRKDAARYRWLADGHRRKWIWNHVLTEHEKHDANDIEGAIDAAMADSAEAK